MSKTRVFCVFEGGGAKGVAHVGFLKAIDQEPTYDVQGYAGTSAGAIVAALAAAGWQGSELYADVNGKHVSRAVSVIEASGEGEISNLSDLFESGDWRIISFIKSLLSAANSEVPDASSQTLLTKIKKFIRFLQYFMLALIFLIFGLLSYGNFDTRSPFLIALFLVLATFFVCAEYVLVRYRGFASTEKPRKLIDTLIRDKVSKDDQSEITFAELNAATDLELKVVAADLETGALKLFSSETTPHVPVAGAVMASAAIPFVFKPVSINGRQYCDGGIVSNLPAWTFDKERLLDHNCLTVTCEIAPPKSTRARRPDLSGVRLISRVAITALFGGSGLNTRGMLRHLRLENWAQFNILDFDKLNDQINLINSSERLAEIKIYREKSHFASIELVKSAAESLCEKFGMNECNLRVAYVRHVNLVDSPPAAYHLWNCLGFEGHTDENLILPVDNSFVGKTMSSKEEASSRFFNFSDPTCRQQFLGNGDTRQPFKLLAKDREWVAVLPISKLNTGGADVVSIAVCIDGNEKFSGDEDKFLSELDAIVQLKT